MRVVRRFEPSDAKAWDDYVRAAAGSHFGQLTAWKRLTEATHDVEADYRLALEGDRVVGVLPLFRSRDALFSAPGGLLADDADAAGALLEPARERVRREGLAWLELRDQRRAWPGLESSDEHVTLELELARDEAAQWAAFPSNLRKHIARGEAAGFELATGAGEVAAFHRVLLENLRDLGTPVRGAAYFRRALEELGEGAELLVLRHAGRPAGGMFLVSHADGVTDPWVSSLRRHFARCPNHVLYWAALRRAIASGKRRFDFGRSQRDSGTYRFKEQWGAKPVQLWYQYALGRARRVPTLETQKRGLALAVVVWKRLPLPLANALGEPAKRRFPEVM